ncbi:MAG: SCO family protein, partial [Cyclobacteriaceae bacterium]
AGFLLLSILFFFFFNKSTKTVLPYFYTPDFFPVWVSEFVNTIFPFSFTNQNGDSVSEKTIKGKVHIADFFFTTCPGICPKMTDNLSLIQAEFESNPSVVLLSYSVTPDRDDVATLKNYADVKGVKSNKWHLLTGKREAIYTLARKSYFVDKELGLDKTADEFLHTENFVLVDKNLRIRGVYNGTLKLEVKRCIEDIRILLQE